MLITDNELLDFRGWLTVFGESYVEDRYALWVLINSGTFLEQTKGLCNFIYFNIVYKKNK